MAGLSETLRFAGAVLRSETGQDAELRSDAQQGPVSTVSERLRDPRDADDVRNMAAYLGVPAHTLQTVLR